MYARGAPKCPLPLLPDVVQSNAALLAYVAELVSCYKVAIRQTKSGVQLLAGTEHLTCRSSCELLPASCSCRGLSLLTASLRISVLHSQHLCIVC